MANNYEYVTTTGVIVPDTGELLTEVQDEFKNAFGQDLVVTPDTPQGVLITAETLARNDVLRNNAALANQINPNLAGGVFLDALLALTGSARDAAERSTVTATLTGVAGTVIPAGVTAATDPSGDLFELETAVIIGVDGTVTAPFQSVEFGPVAAGAGDLSTIVDGVLGWETITNADAATLGTSTQSDQAARLYRKNTLALQGQSISEAITSGLYATDGVRSLSFRENVTDAPVTIDGVNLVAHSIYVCVDGGTDDDVALTILTKKSAGANYNGAVTVNVVDEFSGQTYPVKFDRPDEVAVQVRVTIKASSSIVDPVAAVKEAVLAFAAGELEEEPGFTVGNDVSPFEFAGAINRVYPSIYTLKVEVSPAGAPVWTTDPIEIAIDEIATITSGSITVVIA
jgi:uncharacterized phage protein gp47/JayE